MGDLFNILESIGRGEIDEWGKDQVGNIWEGIGLSKHIPNHFSKVALQAKEEIYKVKARALTETSAINTEFQSTIALVNNIYQGQRRPV